MICQPCRTAGAVVAEAKVDGQWTMFTKEMAITMHERCRGGTWCDCQHKLPDLRP